MPDNQNSLRIPETLRKVKNIVGVFSAKGGVGKSAISLNLALSLKEKGFKVGLVDADIYGPSQPSMLGMTAGELKVKDEKIITPMEKKGIKFISMGLISSERMPVIWRGPMVSGAVMQLLSQTDWGELDYLIIDTPPGTGDVQLTLLQRIPVTATLVVTTPQKVSISDCRKGIEMIKKLDVPILGLIENMSWFEPDDSEKKYHIFGRNGGLELAKEYDLDLLGQIPLVEIEEGVLLYDIPKLNTLFKALAQKTVDGIASLNKTRVEKIPQMQTKE
jgi:ATP-binding protein involved in chromosome partitioning|tara:strand:- start:743 stop:1567 length:825 start_codon:yes stop_codon:yes gene_type:complete